MTLRLEADAPAERAPVSLFGQGVVTFHVEGIFRTPPGWDLWVGGSPNRGKDGIAALTAIVETDWSPFTFTMNWRFTRPGHWVHFDALEPICFLFPIERGTVEAFTPKYEPLENDPATIERFRAWSRSRDEFHRQLEAHPPATASERWQKHYFRGVDVGGESLVTDHRTKLRLRPFDRAAAPHVLEAPAGGPPGEGAPLPGADAQGAAEVAVLRLALAKREWLLEAVERQRDLAPRLIAIDWRERLSGEEFLERYYAQNRPVILAGEMAEWPALSRWTPSYLKATLGAQPVEFQGGRSGDARFEMFKDAHRREAPFDAFIDQILQPGAGNDAYLTAFSSARNATTLSQLHGDLGFLDKFLDRNSSMPHGMMWIGPAGTCTSLHHDLTNNLIAQVVGRKRIRLAPAAEVGKVYNHHHVFSDIPDLDRTDIDLTRYPRLAGLRLYDVLLQPGEILFVPLGWWHQVNSLDFSVTITYTNFRWANDSYSSYPA